ncbi:MAG TPA: rod shape-determining protein MreC [Pyrinomonadaceae bacterium]|nr:rod shape-determining protein MreC [Pyrinomonadaceae bacterium]
MASVRTQREIRQRAPIWLVMLLFANLVVMAVDAREKFTKESAIKGSAQAIASPFQSAVSWLTGTVGGFFGNLANLGSTTRENAQLKQQLANTELELRKAREAAAENERLKTLLHLKERIGYERVVARVIARDASVWFNTIIINRGSAVGIALNMPVVTAEGIVGRVVAVSPWTSQVMLITDEKAAAGGIIGRLGESGALGSVRGLGTSGLVEMRYVSGLQKVEVGDFILTTGQDSIYPPGLNVGTVVEVKHGTATQPHQILIKPNAQLDQLEAVAVLLYRAPQRSEPEQTLPNLDKNKASSDQ